MTTPPPSTVTNGYLPPGPRISARGAGAQTHPRLQAGVGRNGIPASQQPESPARSLCPDRGETAFSNGNWTKPGSTPPPTWRRFRGQHPPRRRALRATIPLLALLPLLFSGTAAVLASASTQVGGAVPARGAVATEASHPHTYVVQAKDSIYSVANRYGLKASAVLAANPKVDPNHLRIGQSLNLP